MTVAITSANTHADGSNPASFIDTSGVIPAGVVQADGRILQKSRGGGDPRGGFPL